MDSPESTAIRNPHMQATSTLNRVPTTSLGARVPTKGPSADPENRIPRLDYRGSWQPNCSIPLYKLYKFIQQHVSSWCEGYVYVKNQFKGESELGKISLGKICQRSRYIHLNIHCSDQQPALIAI